MSGRRAASPARAAGPSLGLTAAKAAPSRTAGGSAYGKPGGMPGGRPPSGPPTPPSLPAARKTGSASSSPSGTPSTSDRLQLRGTAAYTQKPKPSALAGRVAARAAADERGESPQASPSTAGDASKGTRPSGRARAANGDASADADGALPQAPLAIEVGESMAGGDDEPFVPEEEEEGPSTQGDHLMMAKSKMRRQRGVGSPGVGSPGSPFAAMPPT